MDISNLGEDRFLRKDPSQNDETKDAIYASLHPTPKRGNNDQRKIGRPKGNEEDAGAPNIITGTVITSCFIQTSALPSRIELQGNDLTFFDDTYAQDGKVIGDTSRLIFTHGSGKQGEVISSGFILEKRASVFNTYDNVLSLYSPPPEPGNHNYIFFGRNAYNGGQQDRNISSIHFAIDTDSTFHPEDNNPLNGVWEIEYSVDHQYKSRLIYVGNTQSLFPGAPFTGYSSLMIAGEGGITGLGYTPAAGGLAVVLYATSDTNLALGASMIPDTDAAYDIGSPSFQIRNIYVSGAIVGGSVALPGGITWTSGSGSPEGAVVAPIGSLYSNTAGGASTTLYVKTSGSGNTGWTAK